MRTARSGGVALLSAIAACTTESGLPERPLPYDPGAPVLARLNRAQYDATVGDLLGTTKTPGALFPVDESVFGLDNIGSALAITSAHAEGWEGAAADLVDEMFGRDPEVTATIHVEAEGAGVIYVGRGDLRGDGFWAFTSGAVATEAVVVGDGAFVVKARAKGHTIDGIAPSLLLRVDDRFVGAVDVPYEVDAGLVEVPVSLAVGPHRFELGLANPGVAATGARRSLAVDWFEIVGPTDPEGAATAARDRFVPCVEVDRACAGIAVERFGLRAWRRLLTPSDVDWALAVYDGAVASGEDPEGALAVAFRAILVAPDFLFAVEPVGEATRRLDDFEVATRLARFLWSSGPDDELLAVAAVGQLDDDGIRAQVHRMLADPRASALSDNLAGQWLDIRALDTVTPDRATYPAFDDGMRASMRHQLALTADDFFAGRIDLLGLLGGDRAWTDPVLAAQMGVAAPDGGGWGLTSVDGTGRVGWLGTPGWLTAHAHPDRPSAAQRGRWVLDNLLCSAPPPPPPGVVTTFTPAPGSGSVRAQEEAVRAAPYCQACHAQMDGIGFVFHGFDGVGAARDVDELGYPIDHETVIDGVTLRDPLDLAAFLVRDPRLAQCVASRTLAYALGREVRAEDDAEVDAITRAFSDGGLRFDALAEAIAVSDPFLYRAGGPVAR